MDWDYLLSLSAEDLNEEEKDNLYNTVTWFNSDSEVLDDKKSLCFIKICQEVLKYKGEQVEIVLHKLDELATQQAEEEARKIGLESDTEVISTKSRKSSSIEIENLEQKYIEMKNKYRKQVKIHDKDLIEIKKLQGRIINLEQENNRLINEIQNYTRDDQSDASESVKEQQKELMVTVHNKNKQISELLKDIEETEKDNMILRQKLTNTRDELSVATKELTSLTETLKMYEKQINESSDEITKLAVEKENLQEEIRELVEQKQKFEQEMEEFTEEVNLRVDEWKLLLQEKDKQIEKLKSNNFSRHSSISNLAQDKEHLQVSVLNKILTDREQQLMEVKSKLQTAVKEMEDATSVIKKLNEEKEKSRNSIKNLSAEVEEINKQLSAAHGRCQDLQEEVTQYEKIANEKENDIKEILDKLKQEGGGDLAIQLEQIQKLKGQVRAYEKQITSLVRNVNKLQELHDNLEKENEILRDNLGISAESKLDISMYTLKQKQRMKEVKHLKSQLAKLEEENLQIRMQLRSKLQQKNEEILGDFDGDISLKHQLTALIEENEALRKGMHEILDSLNSRKETSLKEVKSETFEMLLRALDVKHISGWYHPAMRLQAELHNLEGINSELREQLRLCRLELQQAKETNLQIAPSFFDIVDADKMHNIHHTLQSIFSRLEYETQENEKVESKLATYQENFLQIQQQIILLYEEYKNEKQKLTDKITELEQEVSQVKDTNQINEEKLNILLNDNRDENYIVKKSLELTDDKIKLERKCNYLESELKKSIEGINNIQSDLQEAQLSSLQKINAVTKENKLLHNEMEMLKIQLESTIDLDHYNILKSDFEKTTTKYRNVLSDFSKIAKDKEDEIRMLEEIRKNLENEKNELVAKISDLSEQLHKKGCDSEDVEKLSQKLAASEVNELTEKQRANHTNNLFELVKEQLQKSEERFKHVENYNKELLLKNVTLQEQLSELESKLVNFIDPSSYKQLQKKCCQLLDDNNNLNQSLAEIKEKTEVENITNKCMQSWNSEKESELLSLKHQIVDLQAISDDKNQIAKLLSEVTYLKSQQDDSNKKMESVQQKLQESLKNSEIEVNKCESKLEDLLLKEQESKAKISILRNILTKSKLQYLGCIPLPSEEKFVDNIRKAINDNHEAFLNLYNSQKTASESTILKEQCEIQLNNLEQILTKNFDASKVREVLNSLDDVKSLQINEMRYRKQCELKDSQLDHVFDRVKIQEEQIIKLEEELFKMDKNFYYDFDADNVTNTNRSENVRMATPPETLAIVKLTKTKETQTDALIIEDSPIKDDMNLNSLRSDLLNSNNELSLKEQQIVQLKNKLTDHEMNLSLFRKQLGDKQSQIQFYERHILELQNKKEIETATTTENCNVETATTINDEMISLKCCLKSCQESLKQKEEELMRYESLLKEDRDKHSMAAALMRDELKVLQKCLAEEKQTYLELKNSMGEVLPGKMALEQYFSQVHSLEDELSDYRTKVSTLDTQLQASRIESVRWRTLANDRLDSMQKLGEELENVHGSEIETYKRECDKWRDEVSNLKQLISKYRIEAGHESDIQKLIKEKDDKIHELNVMLRHIKSEARRNTEKLDADSLTKFNELEAINEQLNRELQTAKKRFEQLLIREKGAREEIRELKGKLMKKPVISSARSDKSDRSIKDQLQKKVFQLEAEIADLKEELSKQIAQNETHRLKISEDFDRWNKQKHWQQTAERLKTKLKTKETDFEKLQQTCSGYRILIERLEREKYNMENRLRNLRSYADPSSSSHYNFDELDLLRRENLKLISENESLQSKLEMQQHHSGALGAAMLQEKLEGQERKIAILELSAKGTVEVRAELERLQSSISSLQKRNLCLEAENLDLKLDLEKYTKEVPHLRNQIQHLENYIEVLKKETVTVEAGSSATELGTRSENKNVQDLERTIFVLKRVVEKLQNENKRLAAGKRPFSDSSNSANKLRRDNNRLKEQYCTCLEKIEMLERELTKARMNQKEKQHQQETINTAAVLSQELSVVKEQLEQKSQLLDRVRVLLQRAATKEKELLDEIQELKHQAEVSKQSKK